MYKYVQIHKTSLSCVLVELVAVTLVVWKLKIGHYIPNLFKFVQHFYTIYTLINRFYSLIAEERMKDL